MYDCVVKDLDWGLNDHLSDITCHLTNNAPDCGSHIRYSLSYELDDVLFELKYGRKGVDRLPVHPKIIPCANYTCGTYERRWWVSRTKYNSDDEPQWFIDNGLK